MGTLGLCIMELFAMYAADRQTDGQKQRLLPLPYGRGHNNAEVACVDQFVPARQEL